MYVRVFDNRGKGGQNEYIHQSLMRIRHMHIAGGCFFSFSRRAARWILHLCSRFFCRVPYHSLYISKCVCARLSIVNHALFSLYSQVHKYGGAGSQEESLSYQVCVYLPSVNIRRVTHIVHRGMRRTWLGGGS